ncbi:MAG TPA: hybrid sensor histidine kinase/response regulator, partial [Gammaproteobacteria bacterium]
SRNIERALIDSIKIRFEKQSLLNELQLQKLEADRANLAKSKFLAAASHDLRQPLHALGLYLDTMNTVLNTEQQRQLAKKMSVAVNALNDLFQRLLDISKLDAGIVEPDVVDFAISELFGRLEIRFSPLVNAKGLDIAFKHNNEALFSDPLLLEIILDNLISNSIRYTDSGGVSVSATVSNKQVLIEVDDTGCGIPEEEQKNIFTEFYQLHNPERDRTKGLGLGLSIVNRLCQLLGYKLRLDSKLGKGTKFQLFVPMGNVEAIRGQAMTAPPSGWELDGAKIIVIDDEAEIREAMHQLLTNWGCHSVCVDSIDEAKSVVKSGTVPDLIIADYRLRESQTGVDAIRSLIGVLKKAVPGILITGDTAPERLQEAARSGFKLLHKPVNAGQLRMVVNHLLARSRQTVSP